MQCLFLSSINCETKLHHVVKLTDLSWVIYVPAKTHVISIECLKKAEHRMLYRTDR